MHSEDNTPTVPLHLYQAKHDAYNAKVKEHGAVVARHKAMIDRRERAIAVLAIACIVSTLYILSSSGCFLGRWPIIIKGGGHGGGEGSTAEGDK